MQDKNNPKGKNRLLTLKDLDNKFKIRTDNIASEFKKGFELIRSYGNSVTFFGSSRTDENDYDYKKAERLAGRIARELGYAIITGGGPGIMEAANKGAYEAKGRSVGLNIKLPAEQNHNVYLTDKLDFYYFFSRKVCLSFAAEAYVYFPGGYGTFDELFEILTLVQTKKIEWVPVILVGKKFWKSFDKLIYKKLEKEHRINPEDRKLYTITDNEDEIIEIIKNAPIRGML